ncbi:homocysteine biosynthesis protein [Candidatus Bathyarchaeota archaeon]|nr:homocysteine biosynthesis protein [Candidatus Bathyarchaeota archaeon]
MEEFYSTRYLKRIGKLSHTSNIFTCLPILDGQKILEVNILSESGKTETIRTIDEINEKIRKGDAVVLTAEEMIRLVESSGVDVAAKEVDVVTSGTFGAMCSSGVFLNFGHSDPPIKMTQCWLNDVPVYKGIAAVDGYLGATVLSETLGFEYGGGHVIEDLVSGKEIQLRAESYGTDCYPRRHIETTITIDDLNQAMLLNPRNCYQRYDAATNSTDRVLYTYMGTLLPNYGNITFSGAGQLNPLCKDPNYETLGIGTRIFLGGGIGYIIGEGTQHNPITGFGTLMVKGDLKQMSSRFLRGSSFYRYGVSLYVGVGIPIPILNEKIASTTAVKDENIFVSVKDYGIPSRPDLRPSVKKVSYADLRSGKVEIKGKGVPSSSLSSYKMAVEISEVLKKWIQDGRFLLTAPVEKLPKQSVVKPLEIRKKEPKVSEIMRTNVITANPDDDVKEIAKKLVEKGIDHLPVVDGARKLEGIVTSWDLARALASDKKRLEEIMTKKVITVFQNESIDVVARKMAKHNISGVPVVDKENHVIGIVTTDDISKKLVGGRTTI